VGAQKKPEIKKNACPDFTAETRKTGFLSHAGYLDDLKAEKFAVERQKAALLVFRRA
jgi:hypothetical protein